jgi:hypothetical protein
MSKVLLVGYYFEIVIYRQSTITEAWELERFQGYEVAMDQRLTI